MSDLKPVSRPPFLLDGRGSRLVVIVVVAIVVAFLKPWGSVSTFAPAPSQAVVASPSASPTPDPLDVFSRVYDPLVFGDRELQPGWALWPAGYLTTFGFAMRTEPTAPPGPVGGGPSPSGVTPVDPAVPAWPDAIDMPVGNHLLLIGVDTPVGFSVDGIRLTRYLPGSGTEDVLIALPPSPWPRHFTVIGIDGGLGVKRPVFWTPGRYRLDLTIDPGAIQRSIEVRVEGPAVDGATASPGPSVGAVRP